MYIWLYDDTLHWHILQVKIIKCLVDNIVVDISFNQLGGLCTLCFLEEVCSYILVILLYDGNLYELFSSPKSINIEN